MIKEFQHLLFSGPRYKKLDVTITKHKDGHEVEETSRVKCFHAKTGRCIPGRSDISTGFQVTPLTPQRKREVRSTQTRNAWGLRPRTSVTLPSQLRATPRIVHGAAGRVCGAALESAGLGAHELVSPAKQDASLPPTPQAGADQHAGDLFTETTEPGVRGTPLGSSPDGPRPLH